MVTDLTPVDDELTAALAGECDRQRETLSLIASENYASDAVLAAQGSVLTNKYAEGSPGDRYYAGCAYADEVEQLAIDRARALFDAEHANVQPHSGTSANLAAYQALLEPGDTILSLSLSHGGHLSHGQPYTMVDDVYDVAHYGVDVETGRLDHERVRERAEAVDPDLLVSGYSAYPRQVDFEGMQAIAEAVDAVHVADIAHLTGLVAAGEHPSPVGVADVVTGSTHKTIRAGRGGMILCGEAYADVIDRAVMPGTQGGPLMHNIAGKAAGFGEALEPEFDADAAQTIENARALAARLADRGFDLVSGGTDVHFALVDFRETHPELTGAVAETALEDVGIVLNKSTVPGEERSSTVTSGIRIGTPAITTRGFDAAATRRLADAIADVCDAPDDDGVREQARETVADLAEAHPIYA
ncbi:Glycine hydroxymethyltransferase [Halorhabdus utahensis DSM 12940]|uniref:Serine hydroxymethyltransferase n=1 Tax=Halorhabdus utahensis (strain DSM 12940 / JCM 11049 / AX-2) TaxID=519442 RepID=C7NV00_HALUD|nr:serine hydroxymethyltransferase [Halorhabdus utahensis]ACV12412.1 Glycine hydroxymethyltransferase [Halorhabdus utahensis DSM 12940]